MESAIRGRKPLRGYSERSNSPSHQFHIRSQSKSPTRSEDGINSHSDSEFEETDHSPTRKSYQKESFYQHSCSQSSSSPGILVHIIIGIIFIIVIAGVVVSGYLRNESSKSTESTKETQFEFGYKNCTFDELKKKYPTQNSDMWITLRGGVEGILNEEKPTPATYLFLYDDEKTLDLVKNIARRASYCFDPNLEPIEISVEDFSSKEANENYGVIIKLYQERMKEGGVAMIANLNEISPKVARALHSICDMYDPLVDRAINILTLKPTIKKDRLIETAEKSLSNMWSSLTDYELGALITRVTDQIIQLNTL